MPGTTMAVIGGKLQGVEAAYLAGKAGWKVLLVDKDPECPASGLCDAFLQLDVTREDQLRQVTGKAGCLLPALENSRALESLARWGPQLEMPILFDFASYRISASKKASNDLFAALDLPCPRNWPECDVPVLAKPVSASGSENVGILNSSREVELFFRHHREQDWILQEYVPGPSYSLEVLGWQGSVRALSVTDLGMDEQHDCCRVTAPSVLSGELVEEFKTISEQIAAALPLNGIMDVEVIAGPTGLRLLEIDARLPSQTPTAVYWSTGVNLIDELASIFLSGAPGDLHASRDQAVIYEHVQASPKGLSTQGEHIMAEAGPLQLTSNFFGADEALTDYHPGQSTWAATLIISAGNIAAAWSKRNRVVDLIKKNRTCAVSRS